MRAQTLIHSSQYSQGLHRAYHTVSVAELTLSHSSHPQSSIQAFSEHLLCARSWGYGEGYTEDSKELNNVKGAVKPRAGSYQPRA